MSKKEPTIANLEYPPQEDLVELQADKLQRIIHNVRLRLPTAKWNIEDLDDIDVLREQLKEKCTLDEYSSKTYKILGC